MEIEMQIHLKKNWVFKNHRTIISVFLLLLFLLPTQAHAQIDWLVGNSVLALLAGTLAFVRGAIVGLIGLVADGVDSVLKFGIADSPVVKESWEIVRNFANMFFIIVLIVMAFGTIFNIRGYDKGLFPRFLIAALLINFSLVIGNVIIDWTQSLSNVFLTSIGDVGARIAQGVSIADLFKQAVVQTYTVDNRLWTETITVFINILLLSIVLFSLLVLLVLSIIRIPILWALLIVSPVAWMAYILPSTNHISQKWWKEFIGWNLFLPIYLFFIYFGTFFLANQQRLTSGIANQSGGVGATFQQLFFFVLVAVFLIGGAKVAMGMSSAAGAGTIATATWARGRAAARFSTIGLAGLGAGYAWKASGAAGAYKEAKEHIQKEGFAGTPLEGIPVIGGYRGQRGLEEKQAKIAGWLGIPGVKEKQFEKNVDGYQQRYRTITDEANLRSLATAGSLEQQVAAKNRLRELGRLTTAEEVALYSQLETGGQHLAARKQAEKIDYGSLSKAERENAYNTITDIDIKRKIQNIRQKKGDFVDATSMQNAATLFTPGSEDQLEFYRNGKSIITDSFTTAERQAFYNNTALNPEVRRMVSEIMIDKGEIRGPELQNALNIIPGSTAASGTPEHRAFSNEANRLLEKARKHDLITAVQIQTRLGLVANKSGPPGTMFTPAQVGAALSQELGNLSVSKILELPDPVLASPEFQTTVVPTLSIQKIEKLLTDASSNQRAIIEPAILAKRASLSNDTLNTRTQPLTSALRRLQSLTRQIRSAPTSGDKKALIAQAQESLDRSQRLIAEIEDIKYADQTLKDSARTVFDYITGTYYKVIQ